MSNEHESVTIELHMPYIHHHLRDDTYFRHIPIGGLFIFRWPEYCCDPRPDSIYRKTHDIVYVDALEISGRHKKRYTSSNTPVYPIVIAMQRD